MFRSLKRRPHSYYTALMSGSDTVLTVNDIVSTESLDLRMLAGTNGLHREVLWAHSCEMADPARWLGPDELLMTVGLCVPKEASEQVAFLSRLDEAGLSGLMIGDHETAPPLSEGMLEEADRRGFPIILAGAQTPYAVVARHVAAANTSSQTLQILKLSKLYHLAAQSGHDPAALVLALAEFLRVGIRVEDRQTGLPVLAVQNSNPTGVAKDSRRYPLRVDHPADLTIAEYPGEELDGFILVHLMKVLEIAVDRVLRSADRRVELGASIMLALLNGTVPAETEKVVHPHLPSNGFQVLAFADPDGGRVARAVAILRLPVIVGADRKGHLALVPEATLPEIRDLMSSLDVRVGASSIFTSYADVGIAGQEATKVHESAQHSDRRWSDFEGTTISVLARSLREASEIVTGVLGPLTDEAPAAVKLRETLFAYLRNDRRWQETADELGIHRQTLSYRLSRIEEETGLQLSRSSDLSSLWIAYQAWETTRAS